MHAEIKLGDLTADVLRKDIKNVHLSVHPPTGRVTISAPLRLDLDVIRVFAIAKIPWIREQQKKLLAQEREEPREYLNRESHYVWGERYLLRVLEAESSPKIELSHRSLIFHIRPGWNRARMEARLDAWYREQLKLEVPALLAKWERLMGVSVSRVFVQRMKTKWGSCNPETGTIRLNTDLAKKPRECLEYIVVHEMVHLLESTHNARFAALMDRFMPKWHYRREVLNRLPIRQEAWSY